MTISPSRRWLALAVQNRGWLALGAVAIVFISGVFYVALRGETWQSTAKMLVSPRAHPSAARSSALGSWGSSGSIGTYEELLTSTGVRERANLSNPVDVRPVPDSRVIEVTASGDRTTVRRDLHAIIAAAKSRAHRLHDLFSLQTLDAPGAPTTSGPGALTLLLATLALAVVAAVATFVLVGAAHDRLWRQTPSDGDLNGRPEREIDHLPAAEVAGAADRPRGGTRS